MSRVRTPDRALRNHCFCRPEAAGAVVFLCVKLYVTSIVASRKGQNGMAVGNVVGSNIFNILLILGLSSTLHPIPVGMESLIDMAVLLVMSIIVFIFCRSGKNLGKKEGFIMVLFYVAYTVYAIMR